MIFSLPTHGVTLSSNLPYTTNSQVQLSCNCALILRCGHSACTHESGFKDSQLSDQCSILISLTSATSLTATDFPVSGIRKPVYNPGLYLGIPPWSIVNCGHLITCLAFQYEHAVVHRCFVVCPNLGNSTIQLDLDPVKQRLAHFSLVPEQSTVNVLNQGAICW